MAFDASTNPGGLPNQVQGIADTLMGSGLISNPAAGAVVASITPAAGTYRVDLFGFLYMNNGTSTSQPDMEFRKGATTMFSFFGGMSDIANFSTTKPGQAGHSDSANNLCITVDGVTAISINVTLGVPNGNYVARIMATRIF